MTTEKPKFLPEHIFTELQRKAASEGLSFEEYWQSQTELNDETIAERQISREVHPNRDLFVADLLDFIWKGSTIELEAPLFSLQTKKNLKTYEYSNGDSSLKVIPSAAGRATVFDRDVLVYLVSQLVRAKNDGQQISKNIFFRGYDYLVSTNRIANGKGYKSLRDSLERLASTTIALKWKQGGKEIEFIGHLIDSVHIVKDENNPEHDGMFSVELSKLLYGAVENNKVLTISPHYFKLRRPLERRLYNLARKHVGSQTGFTIGLEKLWKKSGSQSPLSKFKYNLKRCISNQPLPDYLVTMDNNEKNVIFVKRKTKTSKTSQRLLPHTV